MMKTKFVLLNDMSRENAERAALSAVGKYIGYSTNVLLYISLYDDTPKDKGELRVFLDEERVSNLFGVIPIMVKWSKNANTTPYRLDRRYLNSLKEDKGGVFFLVQRSKNVQHIYYAALSVEDIDKLLQQKGCEVKVELKEVPEDLNVFSQEMFALASKRWGEKVDIPCKKSTANLIEDFVELKGHLEEIKDTKEKLCLKRLLDFLLDLLEKGDRSVIGWHDLLRHYATDAIEIANEHFDWDDLIEVHYDFGSYYHDAKRYDKAEEYYNRALDLIFDHDKNDPKYYKYCFLLATLLFDLGVLHDELKRYDEAENDFKTVLPIQKALADDNPDLFSNLVADTLLNLSSLYLETNRLKKAEEFALKGYRIYKRLSKKFPQVWEEMLDDIRRHLDEIEAKMG